MKKIAKKKSRKIKISFGSQLKNKSITKLLGFIYKIYICLMSNVQKFSKSTIIILILLSIIFVVKIEKDLLFPFGNNKPNLYYQFFTNSYCIKYQPLDISVYRNTKDSMLINAYFEKISNCIENNFTIDSTISDRYKYTFKLDGNVVYGQGGKLTLKNEALHEGINYLSIEVYGLSDYYNYYNFESQKSKIEQIEFNIVDKYICEGDCIGLRKGNIIDVNNINGRSITYRVNDSEVKFIFLPRNKFWNYMIPFSNGLIAGLFLLFLEILLIRK